MMYKKGGEMSREEIMAVAPSVFAERPASRVSGIYQQYPTSTVLDLLGKQDWKVVSAMEQGAKEERERDYRQDLNDDCKMEKAAFNELKSRKLINEIIYTGAGKDFKKGREK